MPALGMSGLWASGLGFPRPLVKGLASALIIGNAELYLLFSPLPLLLHARIPLYFFHAW